VSFGKLLIVLLLGVCGYKAYSELMAKPRGVEAAITRVAHDQLLMYSLATCGFCKEKREMFKSAGIPFTEFFLDKDKESSALLHARMREQGVSTKYYGTPTFDVGGRILPNNPSLDEIKRHLPAGVKRS
jgi:Glutaredoxin